MTDLTGIVQHASFTISRDKVVPQRRLPGQASRFLCALRPFLASCYGDHRHHSPARYPLSRLRIPRGRDITGCPSKLDFEVTDPVWTDQTEENL
jgi:hypothetical protein